MLTNPAEQRRDDNAKRRRIEQNARKHERKHEGASRNKGNDNPPEPEYMDAIITPKQVKGDTMPALPVPGLEVFRPGDLTREDKKRMNHDLIMNRGAIKQANMANKSAAAALKSRLLSTDSDSVMQDDGDIYGTTSTIATDPSIPHVTPAKRPLDEITNDPPATPVGPDEPKGAEGEPNLDTVRLWEPGYRDRYYEQKFSKGPKDLDFRKQVAADYVEGLCWVLLYYFQGCPSWTWFYPHHYAPFAADFQDLKSLDIRFTKGKPFKPFEQLMGVLPAASKHNLPLPFQDLMTNPESEIIDYYPEDFPIDLNGKKFAWQGVVLLPFIEESRLLEAVAKVYPKLTPEDHARNGLGQDVLYMSDQHPLYNDLVLKFYSKRGDTEVS